MRLATKLRRPTLPGKQAVRALCSSQTEGAEALFWANDPIRSVPLYERRRNIQRPLFVQQSHRKRATRRVVKSTKFQGSSAGLLLYHANISRDPCIQWGVTYPGRGTGEALEPWPLSGVPTFHPIFHYFSVFSIDDTELCYFQSKTPTDPRSIIHSLLTSVGRSSKQLTPSCLLTDSTAVTPWWWKWLRMSTSEN